MIISSAAVNRLYKNTGPKIWDSSNTVFTEQNYLFWIWFQTSGFSSPDKNRINATFVLFDNSFFNGSIDNMNKVLISVLVALVPVTGVVFGQKDISKWQKQAKNVTIYRDNWGIPHIYGKTDADAVFGLMYAQCEDDFNRIEMNYIEKLGRMAEVKGSPLMYDDLLMRLVIDQGEAQEDYKAAPKWLKKLCDAFADGINYYLHTHPEVRPVLLTRFEPWFPFLWTDGSIGAINTAEMSSSDLKFFYGEGKSFS